MTQTSSSPFPRKDALAEGAVQVALYGRDAALLSYRNQVLCWAGFSTAALTLPLDPDSTLCPPVVVLCHSLTAEDRAAISGLVAERHTGSKLLALISSSQPIRDKLHYDAVVESLSGADALIKAVRTLLDGAQSRRPTRIDTSC